MTKKYSLSQKLRYRFELFMNKGGSSIFLSLLVFFIVSFIFVVCLRALIVYGLGYDTAEYNTVKTFWDHIWYTFLQMTDPGNMYQDSFQESGWIKISTVVGGFVGVIILSALIAFITTELEKLLYNFRKGRGPVLETEHTVILGWNNRVLGIIEELVIANESEKSAAIVILAPVDKEIMDDEIAKNTKDLKTTKIITTSGNTANLREFERINVSEAKSIIIMASAKDTAVEKEKTESDVTAIKSILALNAYFNNNIEIPVIAEIFEDENRDLIKIMNSENIIALDNWDIMGKLLVQTSLTSGLQIVYNEILSFDLSEMYFYNNPSWDGKPFYDLVYHFPDGIPLGISTEEGDVILRPNNDYKMRASDEILILAEDDSTIDYSQNQLYHPVHQEFEYISLEKSKKRILIIGWHNVGRIFVRESDEYLEQGSVFDVVIHQPTERILQTIKTIDTQFTNIKVNVIDKNAMDINELEKLNPYSYDTILILATDLNELSEDRIDSNTLLLLLMLKKLGIQQPQDSHQPKIITQILNSSNQQLMIQTAVDDFLISNRMITMILAQLSEQPKIRKFYDDIFQEDGSEIYVKPIQLYYKDFPIKVAFKELIDIAHQRNEICLGIRKADGIKDAENNFGVTLNIPKDELLELNQNDFLVVLSEDDL